MVDLCMKKAYDTVLVSVVLFSDEDIITASPAKGLLSYEEASADQELDIFGIFYDK